MAPEYRALLVALAVATGAVLGGFTLPATGGHGIENGDYTVELPFDTDHYPRHENPGGPYNASINHIAGFTQEQFEEKGAPKGIEQLQWIIVSSDHIDFSECKTENTAAFGVDRDGDDPGTETDVSLLSYRENSEFRKHSIVIDFYEGDELAASEREDKGGPGENPEEKGEGREDGDPNAEVYPDDEIVAHQGYKSSGGACYGMPEEPGWYQIHAYGNGTSFSGKEIETDYYSHYFYICVCDSEAEAREKLGPPPSERSDPTTPTPTETPTATPTATATATPTPADTGSDGSDGSSGGADDGSSDADRDSQVSTATPRQATATATEAPDQGGAGGDGGGGDQQAQQQQSNQQGAQQNDRRPQQNQQVRQTDTAIPTTPTIAEGPGFGPGLALVALLGAALLAARRSRRA